MEQENLEEELKCVKKKDNFWNKLMLGVGAVTIYCLSFSVANNVNGCRNRKLLKNADYKTVEEAKIDLKKEIKRLNLENLIINLKFDNNYPTAYSYTEDRKNWQIVLGQFKNRETLQHEMWHIYEVENEIYEPNHISLLPFYHNMAEWRATSYALETPND